MSKIYLFLLAVLLGIELALGALVAPVIFKNNFLEHFDAGILMGQIFSKYNCILIILSIFFVVNELFGANKSYAKISSIMLSLINFSLAGILVFYLSPMIIDFQQNFGKDAIANDDFVKIHSASELTMKILMLVQTILFFIKIYNMNSISKVKVSKEK